MKLRYPLVIAFCSALSAATAFAEEPGAATPPADEQVLITVNGFDVTPDVVQAYRGLRQGSEPRDPQQAQMMILNELVTILMISQDAEARGLEKKPEHATVLDLGRRLALSEAAVQDIVENYEVTDEAIQKAYDEQFSEVTKEYKARHILVKDEDKAKELVAELEQGADFGELAKANSTDGSAAQGGDLGWFTPERMVKPFADAVVAQEKGQFSKEPVKSQFGYHIILVDDVRDQQAPALDAVRAALEAKLRQQAVSDYVMAVRDKTDINIAGQEQAEAAPQAEATK
jgi:peptidyl-prolyl cis-trans isomerase C